MFPFPLGRLCLSLPADDVVRAKRKDIGNIMRSIEKRVWIGEMDDVCLTIEIWNSRYAPVVLLDPFRKVWIISNDFVHQADAYFPDIGAELANRLLRVNVECRASPVALTYSARLKPWDSCIPDGSAMQIVASGAHGLPWRSYVRSAISGGRCPALRLLYSSSAQKAEPFPMDVRSGVAVAVMMRTAGGTVPLADGQGIRATKLRVLITAGRAELRRRKEPVHFHDTGSILPADVFQDAEKLSIAVVINVVARKPRGLPRGGSATHPFHIKTNPVLCRTILLFFARA